MHFSGFAGEGDLCGRCCCCSRGEFRGALECTYREKLSAREPGDRRIFMRDRRVKVFYRFLRIMVWRGICVFVVGTFDTALHILSSLLHTAKKSL